MKTPLKILAPVDFKNKSVNAVRRIVELSRYIESEIILYHVYSRPYFILDPELGYDEETILKIENHSLKKLAELAEEHFVQLENEIPELKTLKRRFFHGVGGVVHSILTAVERFNIDLVAMGTSGLSGINQVWGNKVTEVVEQIKCPVLVIHEQAGPLQLRTIGFAFDYGRIEHTACLDILKRLAEYSNAEIQIVHINKNHSREKAAVLSRLAALDSYISDQRRSFQSFSSAHIEEGLMEYAMENQVDILAILPRAHSYFENLTHDSLTHRLIFHSKVPLLALH